MSGFQKYYLSATHDHEDPEHLFYNYNYLCKHNNVVHSISKAVRLHLYQLSPITHSKHTSVTEALTTEPDKHFCNNHLTVTVSAVLHTPQLYLKLSITFQYFAPYKIHNLDQIARAKS